MEAEGVQDGGEEIRMLPHGHFALLVFFTVGALVVMVIVY